MSKTDFNEQNGPANKTRGGWARAALAAFAQAKGEVQDEADIRDLLTDLLHLCEEDGINFTHELDMATDNYHAERVQQYRAMKTEPNIG